MNSWKRWDRVLNRFSWAVLVLEAVHVVLHFALPAAKAATVDAYAGWFMPVLLAGAVGYVTNWLALWYLFKPYEPRFGGRLQGIIPRQKKAMAVSMGRMVGEKLLNPDALVDELRGEVEAFVADPVRVAKIREWMQKGLLENEEAILDFAMPYLEGQVMELIDSVATDETWGKLWDEGILPRIRDEGSRGFIVDKLVAGIKENAGGIIGEVRAELRAYLTKKLDFPLLPTTLIVNGIMENFADEASLRNKLNGWLERESTHAMLRGKLLEYADQLTAWMKGDEGKRVTSGLIRELKVRGKRYLRTYLRTKVPELIDRAFASEKLRDALERVLLPRAGAKLAQLITDNKRSILEKLRLEERVTEAVDNMSVRTFHETLNDFMAENLCAVQVLGFLLGAAVGAVQLVSRL